METTKERAARCDRATHARRSSSLPAYGSRTASITRRRRRAKRKALRAATLAAAVLLLGGISVAIFTTPAGSKQETNMRSQTLTKSHAARASFAPMRHFPESLSAE